MIFEAEQAEKIVSDGDADLVALGRELLANPAFAYHAARTLSLAAPETVLPVPFAFYPARRDQALARCPADNMGGTIARLYSSTCTNVRNIPPMLATTAIAV